jgi:hypothetical protein
LRRELRELKGFFLSLGYIQAHLIAISITQSRLAARENDSQSQSLESGENLFPNAIIRANFEPMKHLETTKID